MNREKPPVFAWKPAAFAFVPSGETRLHLAAFHYSSLTPKRNQQKRRKVISADFLLVAIIDTGIATRYIL